MTPRDRALELVRLALRDERAAHVLQADPTIDATMIAFHYQQAAEKLLKALLAEQNVDYPRTHNLARILELVEDAGYEVPVATDELIRLTPFAVTFRYEDEEESGEFVPLQAGALIEQLRQWVKGELE